MNTKPGVIPEHRPGVILEYLQVGFPKPEPRKQTQVLDLDFAELRHWGFL